MKLRPIDKKRVEQNITQNCPNCGAPPEDTHYVSPESECFEREGDVDCFFCNHAWNDGG